jgi:deoxyadenosine/deoxycytidine kinase
MMAYISRLKVLRDALKFIKTLNVSDKKFVIITERSLYTDKIVFAKMLADSGKIEYINYQIYLNWFETFSEEFPVHKIVYVKTNPENCFNRILKRSRDGESKIPLDYLTNCSLYHDSMLDTFITENICDKQLILDGNIDIYKNKNQVDKWIDEIDNFINL